MVKHGGFSIFNHLTILIGMFLVVVSHGDPVLMFGQKQPAKMVNSRFHCTSVQQFVTLKLLVNKLLAIIGANLW